MTNNLDTIDEIIAAYRKLVQNINQKASESENRAYGGIIRAGKGKLVENIAKEVVKIAWENLGKDRSRLEFNLWTLKVKLTKQEYINGIKNEEVRNHIISNIDKYFYRLRPDVLVFINKEPKMYIECKSFTENAMMKRILVDFTLARELYPKLDCVLFQLENQLGGDYSELKEIYHGSPSTHTLLSFFKVKPTIITLLERDRKVNKPIHKPEFYKPLKREWLENAINIFKDLLEKY